MKPNKFNKIFVGILILAGVFYLYRADFRLHTAIDNYKGDGIIKYLKAPLLGISGVKIEMPHLDLSKGINKQYNLANIPKTRSAYIVYLVVPNPTPLEKVLHGNYSLKILKDGKLIRTVSSRLKEITNTTGGDDLNKFYFFDFEKPVEIMPLSSKENWSIITSYNNNLLSDSVDSYIMVRAGGSK